MTVSDLRRHRTIKKNSRASKIQAQKKTVQALWRCGNGLVMDFNRNKRRAKQYYIAKQYQSALLAATSLTFSNVAKHFKIMIHGHWLICNLFLLRDVTCDAWYFWVEWFHTQQLLKMKHLEIYSNWFDLMVKLRFSLSHVKLLVSSALQQTTRNTKHRLLSGLQTDGKSRDTDQIRYKKASEFYNTRGTKTWCVPAQVYFWRWAPLMRADQIHKNKNILKSFCFCVSLLLNFNLKETDTPPELCQNMAPRDPEVSISLQINGFPTSRHWVSAVTTTISPCCKASIWGSSSCRAHQLLGRSKKSSRVNRPTAEDPTPSNPPFIAGQHMLLPPTSALPISQHCLAERPALHSARRARPMQPCPATASCGRSWRLPAPSTGSSCSARCSPPNQRYNWIANKLTSPSPKLHTKT